VDRREAFGGNTAPSLGLGAVPVRRGCSVQLREDSIDIEGREDGVFLAPTKAPDGQPVAVPIDAGFLVAKRARDQSAAVIVPGDPGGSAHAEHPTAPALA
jgi:hypothetical protein